MNYPSEKFNIINSFVSKENYQSLYNKSINNSEEFWKEKALEKITWFQEFTKVREYSFEKDNLHIKWFEDGKLNACYNAVDRHLPDNKDRIAFYWEGDDPLETQRITYQELYIKVNEYAAILKEKGVKKGDIVIIYMPMTLEAAYAMLACSRIGAIHSVIFGGFSASSIYDRIEDAKANFIITAKGTHRGGKYIDLIKNIEEAVSRSNHIKHVMVVDFPSNIEYKPLDNKYFLASSALPQVKGKIIEPEIMNSEDPLFILYTSGSTGKPKGIVHTTGGYLLYASITHEYVFNYTKEDIYWCTADFGWITGHSYALYGPLVNSASSVIYESIPSYPDFSRLWQMVEKYKVSIFYTSPTLIRTLMKEGEHHTTKHDISSLKVLGSVGEPINPEAWEWFHKVIGKSKCPIMDTWWQTETGGFLITPLAGSRDLKPGSATLPFFGVEPVLLDDKGEEIIGEGEGNLCIKSSWPGQARTVFGDHKRFFETYFEHFPKYYFSGDGAKRDKDGYYFITGRMDDVLKVSGHRLGTAEIESAFIEHLSVAESAVVGIPHDIKGEGICAFVILKNNVNPNEALTKELVAIVRKIVGPVATPDKIFFVPDLPKTRSGKIMRRILRKIAHHEFEQIGDTTSLSDPKIVEKIINIVKKAAPSL